MDHSLCTQLSKVGHPHATITEHQRCSVVHTSHNQRPKKKKLCSALTAGDDPTANVVYDSPYPNGITASAPEARNGQAHCCKDA